MAHSNFPYAGHTTGKGRGKGPKGKKAIRLQRMQKQTEHEMKNRAQKHAKTSAKRERLSKTDAKTRVLLVNLKDGLL